MGLIQRISDILRSNINDLISKAEDPERMLNVAIDEMKRQVAEAKSRVAKSIADQSRLASQRDREQNKADKWEEKAMVAVRAGRDDLAVEALAKKKEHEGAAQMFHEQFETQRIAVDELKRALGELVGRLEETKRKRNLLIARAKRAEAQRHLAETLNAAQGNSAGERLERLEARVEREEAEAEATWEVAALSSGGYERELEDEIALLEAGSPQSDLAQLKEKMAQKELSTGEEPKALPAGKAKGRSDADLAAEIASAAGEDPGQARVQEEEVDAATAAAAAAELESLKARMQQKNSDADVEAAEDSLSEDEEDNTIPQPAANVEDEEERIAVEAKS